MKKSMVAVLALAAAECLAGADSAAEFRDGTAFALGNMPSELVVEREAGKPVRVEFRYRRPWEKDVEPWKTLRLTVRDPRGSLRGEIWYNTQKQSEMRLQ